MNRGRTKDRPPFVRSTALCYGCRACQLACSFHHRGVFMPEASSIKITRSNRTGAITWQINNDCDACAGEELPMCVKYCMYGALSCEERK